MVGGACGVAADDAYGDAGDVDAYGDAGDVVGPAALVVAPG